MTSPLARFADSWPTTRFAAPWPKHLQWKNQSPLKVVGSVLCSPFSAVCAPIRHRACKVAVPGAFATPYEITKLWHVAYCLFHFIIKPDVFLRDLRVQKYWLLDECQGESVKLTTPDGAEIDCAYFEGTHKDKAIIYIGGNCEQWEVSSFPQLLKKSGASLFTLNPRGTGESTGWRYETGYALDVFSAYQFLIKEKGLKPENILLVGRSMGGAIGTCGAALVQKEYPEAKLSAINVKSFSSLAKEVKTITKFYTPVGFLGRLICFDLNPKKKSDELKGKFTIFYNPEDEVIPLAASMFQEHTNNLKRSVSYLVTSSGHNAPLTSAEEFTLIREIQKNLGMPTSWYIPGVRSRPLPLQAMSPV